jgi:hypothetical protein
LKYTSWVTNNTSGNFTTQQDDNPVNAVDWNNFAGLYDYYRVCAMKIRYVPNISADTTFQYTPGYIFHDANTPTFGATLSVAVAAAYENCKIVDVQRAWKYYRKMYRNIPSLACQTVSSVVMRGYLPTAEPIVA